MGIVKFFLVTHKRPVPQLVEPSLALLMSVAPPHFLWAEGLAQGAYRNDAETTAPELQVALQLITWGTVQKTLAIFFLLHAGVGQPAVSNNPICATILVQHTSELECTCHHSSQHAFDFGVLWLMLTAHVAPTEVRAVSLTEVLWMLDNVLYCSNSSMSFSSR